MKKTYNFRECNSVSLGDTRTHCDHYGKVTVPDLNVDLYDMLVRHQNGEVSTLGGMIRHDAKYSSSEDIASMKVALDNDPKFNMITANYYMKQQEKIAADAVRNDLFKNKLARKASTINNNKDNGLSS